MVQDLSALVAGHLAAIYPDADAEALAEQAIDAFWPGKDAPRDMVKPNALALWSEADSILITYGDSIKGEGERPLSSLLRFLRENVHPDINGVHVLPFFPWSSDDGFSVIDYDAVDPALGTWDDINLIGQEFRLMVDLVLNHCSAESAWFKAFLAGEPPFETWFKTASPEDDLSDVVRPRPHPLLARYDAHDGPRHVWCTFSADQVDVNFGDPRVLMEFLAIMRRYIDHGARIIRLDAVAFLWKQVGTSSIHLAQTHEVIRLMRTLVDRLDAPVVLLTETNVPHAENLSYFGNQNEAHAIYNFSLPPLLLHALLSGSSLFLRRWLMSMPPALPGCAYLNFVASHDGIGVRGAEGILPEPEINAMIEAVRDAGGAVSMRARDGVEAPYEMNVSLWSAMSRTIHGGEDDLQFERFICCQTVMMSIEGLPAFYIHSLLATPNDREALNLTGHNRAINRRKWDREALDGLLADPASDQSRVLAEIKRRVAIRRRQPAFHPNATQFTLQLPEQLLGLWRQSMDRRQSIFCVYNLTPEPQALPLAQINLIWGEPWLDLLTGEEVGTGESEEIILAPYQAIWVTNMTTAMI
ncbi:sugar phosphorylase [Rhodovulum sp. DZ06]|uniref:sugar phosphorylase n=1 Tax=Rhodovulum sp. DZ06 TaxID=3425126 RepID=UPI003D327210